MNDHRDGDPFNNRWRNLRRADRPTCASRCRRGDTPACAGIALDRRSGQWTARVCARDRVYFLGRFSTNEAAHEAYAIAARLLHAAACSG